jgi:hypothetical protein
MTDSLIGTEHRCPRRDEMGGSVFPGPDWWNTDGGIIGALAQPHCSYCGSLHPVVFMDLIEAGVILSPTDKNYKVYLEDKERCGPNGDKFYFQHLDEDQRTHFMVLLNADDLHFTAPGHFYVRPFFIPRPSGDGVTDNHSDPRLREIDPKTGMQSAYLVAPADERKLFVRPVRTSYKHLVCGAVTTMSKELAETYAAKPAFYSGTFCVRCKTHFPVGEDGEFVWDGTDIKVGT